MKITLLAPAKINLMLHVVGTLADGYHHLQSLVTFASLGDYVTVEKAKAFRFTVDGPFASQVPLGITNSAVAAAHWLEKKYPGMGQAHIHLTKNLPVASGIGGGSSDAAATIAALLKSFDISLTQPEEETFILASGELGTDVPMCLAYQFGWGPLVWIDGSGRETLPDPVNASLPGVLLLVNPGIPVSTPAIFQQIHPPYTAPQDFKKDFRGNLLDYLKTQKNDLMVPAMKQEPKIKDVIESLQNAPGCLLTRMSGSGATCFGVFEDKNAAQKAKSIFLGQRPEFWLGASALLPPDCLPDGLKG